MGSGSSKLLSCPICNDSGFKKQAFVEHFRKKHNKQCTKCGLSGFETDDAMHKHYDDNHNGNLEVRKNITCPKCTFPKCSFADEELFLEHMSNMHSSASTRIICPIDCKDIFSTSDLFVQHLLTKHNYTIGGGKSMNVQKAKCPNCSKEFEYKELIKHIQNIHIKQENHETSVIVCPKCTIRTIFTTSNDLVNHLQSEHGFTSHINQSFNQSSEQQLNKKLPKVGDKILAMWEESMWQYFHATIKRVLPGNIRYEIDWDDGDTTGRLVDYHNIAVDKAPEKSEIGIGSIILFPQGGYKAGATQETGGRRWHQGVITNVCKSNDGTKLYDGHHTKGGEDGKFVTYKGYSYEFKRYRLNECRVGPNVFDILDEDLNSTSVEDVDIYFSHFSKDLNSDKIDPNDVAADLKSKGLSVINSGTMDPNEALSKKVSMMKNSKVFVACISDDYVQNETCKMEFQFAKSTLKKPVVPLVIGGGMDWQLSVVGMLITGELYIHIKDKTVQDEKIEEMLRSISTHLTKVDETLRSNPENNTSSTDNKPPGDIFLSYCWSNSYLAEQNVQINVCFGNEFNDPRLIKKKIQDAGFNTWLDIEQLKSGDQGVGLFEQLAASLKESKVVVTCISDEYAKSANCRMEFQFACKALQKPIIPLIVGSGNEWTETVVGMLIKSDENIHPINMQNITSAEELQTSIDEILRRISSLVDRTETTTVKVEIKKIQSNKPKVGDHVVSHHFGHCYYMATVASYNTSKMEYTVNWDDGDSSGKVQPYDQVAVDKVPNVNEIGVGSVIFFPQGSYGGTEGNNTGGVRYHEGIITKVTITGSKIFIDGNHTRGTEDGKHCSYRDYSYNFNVSIQSIRLAATALDSME